MNILRAFAMNVGFYILTITIVIIAIPTAIMPKAALYWVARLWATWILWLIRVTCNITYEIRGLENLPKDTKPLVIAPLHQSAWDVFGILQIEPNPVFAFKNELIFIPFFGQLLFKAQLVRIKRGTRRAALDSLVEGIKPNFARGETLVLFPEGTRRSVNDPHVYKYGLSHLYQNIDITVVPVALNAGLFWPRRTFKRYEGTVILEVLPAIPPHLPIEEFERRYQTALNEAGDRLIAESRAKGEGLGA
jgi:1-acyl-sn-glycerol-3-phosphate acyltransferase